MNIERARKTNNINKTRVRSINDLICSTSFDSEYIRYYDENTIYTDSYIEFISKVKSFSEYLKTLGIKSGDRVASFSHNHIDTVRLMFACWNIGAVFVPVNTSEDINRAAYILNNSSAKILFTRKIYKNKINQILKYSRAKSLFFELISNEIYSMECLIEFAPNYDYSQAEALIVYTSGTTGNPKGVVLTQENLITDAHHISEWHGIKPKDVMMCVLPIHHVNGIVVTLITPFYCGAKTILTEKFHSHTFFNLLQDENVKIVSVVPTLLQFLLHSMEESRTYDLKNFSHIICGAGPLTSELASNFEKRFGLKIVHGYGLSETTCYSCFIPIDLNEDKHRKYQNEFGFPSIGIPLDCNEMEIHDENGVTQKEYIKGEIVIRGYNVMKGYYQNEDANSDAFKFGWFRSGDEGFFVNSDDGKKYFFITGRIKELIIRGGVNISPLEIDEVLSGISEIKAGIAVGFENEWYGEEVGALVILKNEEDANAETSGRIISKCKEKLPFNKIPKVIEFTNELPVTSTGKYQRNKVKFIFEKYKKIQFKKNK